VLPRPNADQAVLLGDEDRLLAIVTSSDVADFLWGTTEPFILIQDVELAIRDLMWAACPAQEALTECIRASVNRT
jgi:hypothetical protein